jgi:dihydrofolate reductase
LPGRTTVVVTRNNDLAIEGCIIAHSLQEAIYNCIGDQEIFIVGGAELYRQAISLVDTLCITEIQQDVEGDAHFPAFDKRAWRETSRVVNSQTAPQPLEYHFVTYQRTQEDS